MCGIAGVWSASAEAAREDAVRRMTDAISHRGPDDSGHWCDENHQLALGHRRLSIIDVSPLGHQPMGSRTGRYQIVFNGEIYNFESLRGALIAAGESFRGRSDTEVLLAAIERWGLIEALRRAVGMFALALWDRETHTLSLARDRVGEKPLYYGSAGGSLLFGSELKALRAHPAWRGAIDRGAIALFLRHNYIPAPYSIYENVRKVVPGTVISFRTPQLDAATQVSYWSARDVVESGTRDPLSLDEQDLVDRCEQQLRQTIADQMISDVPLGAFLSGGVDSSLIVALMQAQSSRPVKTFTIGFHVKEYDEAQHARAVAAHLGTDHTELYVTPQETLDVIPRLPQLYDEPFADASQVPTFLVAQLARRHVTVSLSGDGGDELFGGYYRYFWSKRLWSGLRYIPPSLRRGLSRSIRAVSPARWDSIMATAHRALPTGAKMSIPGDRMHKLAGVLAVDSADEMYHELVSHWREPRAVALGADERTTALT
ncbi:MAG TPA: asparagine synthase (glutamine-hydrolyzing), partial [Gemmatimonadaceae bacterium]|nr:asparagine synthase (glutamine-hydrolyzing) [Gemmatimonadaceae bacterium]